MKSLVVKGIEFNVPIWIVSIDISKAFDRLEHNVLFEALKLHGVKSGYIGLLQLLYSNQKRMVGEFSFNISRGVRQGDTLSPTLLMQNQRQL